MTTASLLQYALDYVQLAGDSLALLDVRFSLLVAGFLALAIALDYTMDLGYGRMLNAVGSSAADALTASCK